MDRYNMYDAFDVSDLETLEFVERRARYVPEARNNDLDELDDIDFKESYRFHKDTIEEIVRLVKPRLESMTLQNGALLAEEKVLAAIRFFAFGNQQSNIGDLHRISQPACSRAINEVASSLAELAPEYIYLPQTEDERVEISKAFANHCGFPDVCGALGCTLIKIQSPGGNMAERFRSRKGTFALNVQTLSDMDLFIRNVVVRWPGSTHNSTIFDHSYLRAHLEVEVPKKYSVLGDSGYPLRSYLMTPFLDPANASQTRYNSAHILGRNVVERQYGVWKRRFACISSPLRCRLENAQKIIVATAVLHNIAIKQGDSFEGDDLVAEDDNDFIDYNRTLNGISRRNAIVASHFTF